MMPEFDVRAAKLVDVPLISRLVERSVILDTEMNCTRESVGAQDVLFTSAILAPRGVTTLVGRAGRQSIVGQFRLKHDGHLAQIVYIAPNREANESDTAWLHLIDAMASEAGRRGAHALTGEVDESSSLFETMRTAGFAVYARQQIWRLSPGWALPPHLKRAPLVETSYVDDAGVQALVASIVPRLVQPVALAACGDEGLVYRHDDGVQGYLSFSEGKYGVYLVPFLHPDILYHEASAILAGALARVSRAADRMPVYICIRRYQDWLEEPLIELGFEPGRQQAVMVRHITAGVRQPAFTSLAQTLEAMPSVVRPPTSRIEPHRWSYQEPSALPYGTTDYGRYRSIATSSAKPPHADS